MNNFKFNNPYAVFIRLRKSVIFPLYFHAIVFSQFFGLISQVSAHQDHINNFHVNQCVLPPIKYIDENITAVVKSYKSLSQLPSLQNFSFNESCRNTCENFFEYQGCFENISKSVFQFGRVFVY